MIIWLDPEDLKRSVLMGEIYDADAKASYMFLPRSILPGHWKSLKELKQFGPNGLVIGIMVVFSVDQKTGLVDRILPHKEQGGS